jgi:hypothetical protein
VTKTSTGAASPIFHNSQQVTRGSVNIQILCSVLLKLQHCKPIRRLEQRLYLQLLDLEASNSPTITCSISPSVYSLRQMKHMVSALAALLQNGTLAALLQNEADGRRCHDSGRGVGRVRGDSEPFATKSTHKS